jgi:flagellar motility protein MotE (MotC chaperone)
MTRFYRDLRLIPVALIASACLLALKTADLVLDGPAVFGGDKMPGDAGEVSITRAVPGAPAASRSSSSWATQMFNFPDGKGSTPAQDLPPIIAPKAAQGAFAAKDNPDITGSVKGPAAAEGKPAIKPDGNGADKKGPPGKETKPLPSGTVIPTQGQPRPTGAERAILERLQQRREELDARARELDLRESLIQSAEKRVAAQLSELKDVEARIKTETQQKDEVESARLKSLITMYENMKPRDAAKIFNGLDDSVLIAVASQINPRTMAEILAQMQPEVAQHLTIALASKAQLAQQNDNGAADLPKISGQPTTPQSPLP